MNKKKPGMTREQATELYHKLHAAMIKKYGSSDPKEIIAGKARMNAQKNSAPEPSATTTSTIEKRLAEMANQEPVMQPRSGLSGQGIAVMLVIGLAFLRMGFAVLEHYDLAGISEAEASATRSPETAMITKASVVSTSTERFSPETVKVLTALDKRRAELETRNDKLNEREKMLEFRDKEMSLKLTELRTLTERLKLDREQGDRKREEQLAQLANVYSSMHPEEAAKLIEQLDITIALMLMQRMPEKRMGQILALMSADRALNITKTLSGAQ